MASKWLGNTDARQRVTELLEQGGVPLELKVADVCQRFSAKKQKANHPRLSAEKLVYSPIDEPDLYREIDQVVHIYNEFEVGANTGIQLTASTPIECKHRHNTEYFAFPPNPNRGYEGFPVWSTLAASHYFRLLHKSLRRLSAFASMSVSTLEIRDGTTPIRWVLQTVKLAWIIRQHLLNRARR